MVNERLILYKSCQDEALLVMAVTNKSQKLLAKLHVRHRTSFLPDIGYLHDRPNFLCFLLKPPDLPRAVLFFLNLKKE